jgi:hypothetical protein
MSEVILERDGIVVCRFAGGTAIGFQKLTPCISVSTPTRGCGSDSCVMTLQEAEQVAKAILDELKSLPSVS